jgi:hypothetical protein
VFFDIPDESKTENMAYIAVSHRGSDNYNLYIVPEKLKSERVCEKSVESNGQTIAAVPAHLISEKLCGIALLDIGFNHHQYTENEDENFSYTDDGCEAVAKHNGFKRIPSYMLTEDMCYCAVSQHGCLLRFVPDKFKTPRVCEKALSHKQCLKANNFIPN